MRHILLVIFLLCNFSAQTQVKLTTNDLEKVLTLDMSSAYDYAISKGLSFIGGDVDAGVLKETNSIRFGFQKPLKLILMVNYSKTEQGKPVLVNYSCVQSDLSSIKAYYIKQGFKLKNSFTNEKVVKYFFDKVGSSFSLAFVNSFDMTNRISTSAVQFLSK